jgi:hypothetical protein
MKVSVLHPVRGSISVIVFTAVTVFRASLSAQVESPPAVPPSPAAGTPPIMNQPVVVGTFENVEMERLRLAKESENIAREEAAYREQLLGLQQKLARASFTALPTDQVPLGFLNDFRSFLSANAGEVSRSEEYYRLLTETLTDLIPSNPYAKVASPGEPSVARAEEKLQWLFAFSEDEGISRNIMAQVAAVRGGVFETDQRRNDLRAEYQALEKRKKNLTWNISVASQPNLLNGGESAGAKSIPMYREELRQVDERLAELKGEAQGLVPTLQKATRELQFQQFIIELAVQQRYVHSLIAAGFYRLYSRNMAIAPEAYPQQQGAGSSNGGGNPNSGGAVGSPGSEPLVPFFNSVPALETFLMNRISDTAKSRQSIDNMLQSRQLSAAENQIRELVLTAKYQPELHTIPYGERQRILAFSERIRSLSDSLSSRNYAEIRKLAEEVESISADPGMADIKSFAEAHPKRAIQWVRQAEVAMKVGDTQSMRSLMKAAHDLAPLDPEVAESLRHLEADLLEGGELKNDLMRLVEADNYEEVYRRRSDFARFYGSDAEPELKEKVEKMLEKESSIQEVVKKCEEFEVRSSHPDSWMALSELLPELSRDERIKELRDATEKKCRAFASAYDSAREHEEAGNSPVALAWYLTALAEAPATTAKLKPRIEELGRIIAND